MDATTLPYDDYQQDPQEQRARALRLAQATNIGVVTIKDGTSSRTYPNNWVPSGIEHVIDLTEGESASQAA